MKTPHFETLQLHAGQEHADPVTGARAVPIYQTTSYVFDSCQHAVDRFELRNPGNIYTRLTNPTQEALEARVAALEGGTAALAVASGAAAVAYALENVAGTGDHIVAANNIYGGTYHLLADTMKLRGVDATFVNPRDPQNIEDAIRPNTKAVFIETFGNPNSDVTDIDAIARVAHRHNIPLIVDNTFATPYLLRPLEHGADVVVHSATKFLGGHGTSLGGVIVDGAPDAAFVNRIRAILLRDTGACISPFNAFLLLQGIETLSLRVERHVENALKVVDFLARHPKVAKVNHPALPDHPDHGLYTRLFPNGACSIFTFEIKGGKEDAWKFIDSLQLFSLLANVADSKSLVIHPATTTHGQLSEAEQAEQHITPSTIRLSIGTEHIDDIIADLSQAFDKE